MPDNAFSALFRLDVHRQVTYFRKATPTMVVVAGLFYLVFGRGSEGMAMAAGFLGFSFAFFPTMNALPDKLDGTFEFLTSLPVPMGVLAAARICAAAAAAFLASLLWTGAAGYASPALLGVSLGPGSYVAVFAALWIGATVLSALLSGMVVRFSVESLARLPIIVVLLMVGIPTAMDRFAPDSAETLVRWVLQPRAPALFFTVLIAAEVVGVWLGFRLLRSGLERFRPPAARIAS